VVVTVSAPRTKPEGLKTFSHLAGARRMPSEYDLTTKNLLYYPAKGGFEVQTPIAAWYERHQVGSPLKSADWDAFADPRATTYAAYTAMQRAREAYVDGLLQRIEETRYDNELTPERRDALEKTLPVLRFPFHAFQMLSAYVGQMAPSGRIAIVLAFQTADEVRRIHRIAYRMAQLRMVEPSFGDASRTAWERNPAWQPLREAVERALVAYDWGEAFVALNVCIKPLVDELFMIELPRAAGSMGDPLLGAITHSLMADCTWQRDWTRVLSTMLVREHGENKDALERWARMWTPRAERAVEALAPLSGSSSAFGAVRDVHRAFLTSCGLEVA
jgi:toluene monooxygenase system protein E